MPDKINYQFLNKIKKQLKKVLLPYRSKVTEKGTVTLSVEGVKRYEDAKAEAEENVPVLVKLLKAQLEKLQQRLVEIKKEIDALNANDSLDEETKKSMLAAKQDEIAHIMGAIKEVNNALIEAMKPPENPEPVKNSE